jgi:hypothetical protein
MVAATSAACCWMRYEHVWCNEPWQLLRGLSVDIVCAYTQDNEDDKSEPRIKEWVKQLKDEGIN